MTLETLLPQLKFNSVIEDAVKQKIIKSRRQIEVIAETAYNSDNFAFPLCKRMPLTRLVVVVYLLLQKYADYKAIGVTDEIILDTFRDVSLRANLYYKQNGKIGISKDDVIWFRHIMNVHIFKIGVLQYQTFNMIYLDEETIGEPYMVFTQEQKLALPNGSPVINCHIQKGANISAALVNESIEQAKVFFKDCFPSIEYKAFLCYSWLLYPPMLNMLSENSNIKQFAKYFSIVGECNDSEQAKENLFDYGKHNPPCKPTTLQRMAKEDNSILGYGCGVIML
ncbi:MAG: DUF5596 domain-containing protein [Oscillospiraceae bacterium]|nr:DUF5596 domain-containing protein [Oscillospiraceae bacterium]